MNNFLNAKITDKNMKRLLIIFLLTCTSLCAQPWMNNLYKQRLAKDETQPRFSFYEVQKAFNDYWKDKTIEKGKGWKQFKRWEWFVEPRLNSEGLYDTKPLWETYLQSKEMFPEGKTSNKSDWKYLGPDQVLDKSGNRHLNGAGRINCIAFDPNNSNIIWVGSPSGGLWKSVDGGATWSSNTDFLDALGVSDIVFEPNNPLTIYLLTGDCDHWDTRSIGLLKSTDGGQTWFVQDKNDWVANGINYKLIIHHTKINELVVASVFGILKSYDYGSTWVRKTDSNFSNFTDIQENPSNPNILFAASSNDGIFKSSDFGETWQRIGKGFPSSSPSSPKRKKIAIATSNPSVMYVLFSDSLAGFGSLFKSENAGNDWIKLNVRYNLLGNTEDGSDQGGQAWYDLALVVSPTNPNEVYVGGVNIWKSMDGGNSWNIVGHWFGGKYGQIPFVHADQHALEFKPGTSELYVGNDGGFYKTLDGGKSWQDLSNGLGIQQFYRIGSALTDSKLFLGGAQDNGTSLFNQDKWNTVFGGDGMDCLIDYSNDNVGYVSTQNGHFWKTRDKFVTLQSIDNGIVDNGPWITPLTIHPTDPNILYRSTSKIYKSVNGGMSWSSISNTLYPNVQNNWNYSITKVEIAKSNPNIVYAVAADKIFKTVDGGYSWTEAGRPFITNNWGEYISDLEVDITNPNVIWATCSSGSSNYKLAKSVNGGTSWLYYIFPLREIGINCIITDEDTPADVYVGTDIGVYFSSDLGLSWELYNKNFPHVIVNELEILGRIGKIRAATYGRGIWESPLNNIHKSLKVVSPDKGDTLKVGSIANIKWESKGFENVKIEYTVDNGNSWLPIVNSYSSAKWFYAWQVPNVSSNKCKIRISDLSDNSVSGVSNENFTIKPVEVKKNLSLVSPNGNEILLGGSLYKIKWDSNYDTKYAILFTSNLGDSWQPLTTSIASTEKEFSWTIPQISSSNCKIKLTDNVYPSMFDISDNPFRIISTVDVKDSIKQMPTVFALANNYPNPFNPTTTIKFSIPVGTKWGDVPTTLKVYDLLGREVATLVNEEKAPGNYEVKFDCTNLPSGVYFYRLQAGEFSATKKLILLK